MLEWTTRESAEAAAAKMHGTDLHTSSKKDAKNGGARAMKATTEVGPAMDQNFLEGTQGEDAPPPPPPPPPPSSSREQQRDPPFSMSELQRFPMRASCLATHTTLPDLQPQQRRRLMRYLTDAVEGLPELKDVVLLVESVAGQSRPFISHHVSHTTPKTHV